MYFHYNYEFKILVNNHLEMLEVPTSFCELLGQQEKQILGQSFSSLVTCEFQEKQLDLSTPKTVEIISHSGGLLFMEVIFLEKEGQQFIFARNLTSFHQAKRRLAQIGHYAKIGYWQRLKDNTTEWSDEIFSIFDIDRDSGSNESHVNEMINSFSYETRQLTASHLKRLFTQGGEYELEVEILTKKNIKKWVRTKGIAIESHGEIVRVEGVTQDVTEYRENLKQLFDSQKDLSFALSAIDMGVWQLDVDKNVMTWDENTCKIFGVNPAAPPVAQEELADLIFPEDLKRLYEETAIAMAQNDPLVSSWFRIKVNGETRYIATRGEYSSSKEGAIYRGVSWDITKEKKAEELIRIQEANMISSARLSALGEMAGSIAHEINNPLSVILTRATQMQRNIAKNNFTMDVITEGLAQIEKTCNRILKIMTGLRTMSRDGKSDPFVEVCLQNCIAEISSLVLQRFKSNNVELKISVPDQLIHVKGRSVQIEQVLMNLLNNSYDAIIDREKRSIYITLFERDNLCELRITDSGEGIPPHLEEKAFEPFYTTKEIGKGTGIGLSISRSIIEDHGGELTFIRETDTWYFRITLPVINP